VKSKRVDYSKKWHRPIHLFRPGKPGSSGQKIEEPLDKKQVESVLEETGQEQYTIDSAANQPAKEMNHNQDAKDLVGQKNIVEELYQERFGDTPSGESLDSHPGEICSNYPPENPEERSPENREECSTEEESGTSPGICLHEHVAPEQFASPVEYRHTDAIDAAGLEQANGFFIFEKTPDEPITEDVPNHIIHEPLPGKEKAADGKSAADILGKLKNITKIVNK
jgi:hypothetical protein